MRRYLVMFLLLFVLLGFCLSAKAQSSTQGVVFGGYYQGFGYGPGPEVGTGVELQRKSFGLEALGSVTFSPKITVGNGVTFEGEVRPVFHFKPKVGLVAQVDYSALSTSLFHKAAITAGGGLAYKPADSVDFYFQYFQQFEPPILAGGAESNKLKGASFTADIHFFPWLTWREVFQLGHVYTQGNPLCDGTVGNGSQVGIASCPRGAAWSAGFESRVMFIFK